MERETLSRMEAELKHLSHCSRYGSSVPMAGVDLASAGGASHIVEDQENILFLFKYSLSSHHWMFGFATEFH